MLSLAIQPDDQRLMSGKQQSFSNRWIELARQHGHEVKLVDVYSGTLREQLEDCDGFLWWFAHLPAIRRVGMRVAMSIQHGLGIPTFPNWQTIWHFDDKLAQKYLLDAAGVPMPETHAFYDMDAALAYCRRAAYPVVVKLTGGICSENVRKVLSVEEAEYWVTRMFTSGLTTLQGWPRPSTLRQARKRFGLMRQAALGRTEITSTHRTELQQGYILFQEFVPGNTHDTRITVIGDRAFAFRRFNREGDFRASGSGRIDWDPEPIEWRKIALAFEVAQKLGTQSLAVDILVRPGGSLVMNEISYYYEGWAVGACPGHWRPDGTWQEGSVAPEHAIFEDFVSLVQRKRTSAALESRI